MMSNVGKSTTTRTQSAQNLYSDFWSSNLYPGYITPPTPTATFNGNALGEYTFVIEAYTAGGAYLGDVAMQVNVVPEPEAYGMALAGLGVVGVAGAIRRRRV